MSRLTTSHKLVTDQVLTTDAITGLHAVCTEPKRLITEAKLTEHSVPVKPLIDKLKPKKISMLAAALQVLQDRKIAMTCPEIIDVLAMEGLWVSQGGKTPVCTLNAAISRRIKDLGDASPIRKTGRGKFEAGS